MSQFNEEDRKWLFETMRAKGVDTGSYDEFKASLNNKEDREWYYQKGKDYGLDLGSQQDFDDMMWERPQGRKSISQEQVKKSLQQRMYPNGVVPTEPVRQKDGAGAAMKSQPQQTAQERQTAEVQSQQSAQMQQAAQAPAGGAAGTTVGGAALPEGFGELDITSNRFGRQAWNTPQPGMVTSAHNGNGKPVDTTKQRKEQEKRQRETLVKMQKDQLDYAQATGRPLRNIVNTPIEAPVVARDEDGNMVMGEDGQPLQGITTDQDRVAKYQQQEREYIRKKMVKESLDRIQKEMEDKAWARYKASRENKEGVTDRSFGSISGDYANYERMQSPEELLKRLNEMYGYSDGGKTPKDFGQGFLEEHQSEIEAGAARLGMPVEDFVWQEVIPNLSQDIAERFQKNMSEKYSVKDTADFLSRMMMNSTTGTIARMATFTPMERQFMSEEAEKSRMGHGANYNSSWKADLVGEIGMFSADAPALMVGGEIGGLTAKAIGNGLMKVGSPMMQRLGSWIATGGNSFMAANAGRVEKYGGMALHAQIRGGASMGSFMGTSSMLQEASQGNTSLAQLGKAFLSGALGGVTFGTTTGMFGVGSGALGEGLGRKAGERVLKQVGDVALKAAYNGSSFLVENQIFAGLDYISDPDNFNWVEASKDALYMQLASKLSSGHGVVEISKSFKNLFAPASPKTKGIILTDGDRAEIQRAFAGMDFDAITSDVNNVGKILRDTKNISWVVRQKVAGQTMQTFESSRPRTMQTNMRTNEIREIGENGELIEVHPFEGKEEGMAILQQIKDKTAYNDMISDFEKLQLMYDIEPSQEEIDAVAQEMLANNGGLRPQDVQPGGKSYDMAVDEARSRSNIARQIIAQFAQENGMTEQEVLEIMNKKPIERVDYEADLMVDLAQRFHDAAYPKGEKHTDQSRIDGETLAGDEANVNPETSTQIAQEFEEARNAYLNYPVREDVQEGINSLGGNARLDDIYMYVRQNYSGSDVDGFLQVLADYANAMAKRDGYISKTGANIEETVNQEIDHLGFHGTVDEAPDTNNIIRFTHDGVTYTLLNGQVGTMIDRVVDPTNGIESAGATRINPEKSGDMIIALGEDGRWVSFKPDAMMEITDVIPKEEYGNQRREELGVAATTTLVETGVVKPQEEEPAIQSPGPKTDNNDLSEVVGEGQKLTAEEQAGAEASAATGTGANEAPATPAVSIESVTDKDGIKRYENGVGVDDAIAAGEEPTGWIEIDEKTGKKKIYMYLPNVRDRYEAEKTIAHETVGHYGLRELLGEKGYKSYMRSLVFDLKTPELSKYIQEHLSENGFDMYRTVDEFLADAAEKGYGDLSMWQKVKDSFTDAMRSAGFTMAPSISDVKYMVWLSKHNLEKGNVVNEAQRQALLFRLGKERYEAKVRNGEFVYGETEQETNAPYFPGNKTLFRHTPSAKYQKHTYEKALKRFGYVWKEAHIDAMQSAVELMRAISGVKKIEDIPSAENFVLLENQMSSKEEQMDFLFNRDYMEPLDKAVSAILPDMGKGIDEQLRNLQLYMIKKHGLERNRYIPIRDAIRDMRKDPSQDQKQVDQLEQDYEQMIEDNRQDLRDGNITLREYFDEIDTWIKMNIDPQYKAGDKDYSGLGDMMGTKGSYDDSSVIDDVMSTEAMIGGERINNLWEKTKAVSQFGLDTEYEGGLDSKEKHDKVSRMFEWYVPLRGYDEKTADEVYDYLEERGNQRKWAGPVLMNAKGRESLGDVDVFATLGSMSSDAINRALRNQMKQAFARFVRNHYNSGGVEADERLVTELPFLWAEKQYDPTTGQEIWVEKFPDIPENAKADDIAQILDQYQQDMKAKKSTGDAKRIRQNSSIPYRPASNENKAQHIVDVWINGEKHAFIVNGNPRAAQAINGQLKAERNSNILWLSSFSHFMAKMNTSYSPDFIMRNTERDLIYSAANIAVKENAGYWFRWAKNYCVATGRAAFGVPAMNTNLFKRYRDGKLNMNNETDRYFKEFMENGGETGWVERKNLDKWKKLIREGVRKESAPEKVGKAVINALPDAIEAINERAENLARFATYMTSRQSGRTIVRSISDAKEVSVNFNRKGAGRKTVGINKQDGSWLSNANAYMAGWSAQNLQDYIMFYNAGVQGMTNMIKNVTNHPIKGTAAFAAFALAGMLMPRLNQFLFNEDDDKTGKEPENPYAELPEWVRRNNLCIYSSKGNFITIALPIELRAMYGIGDMAASYISNPELRSTKNAGVDILTQLNQVAPLDFMGEGAGPLWSVVPSGIRPFAEAAANVNWLGQPIEREEERWNENRPRWTRAFKNVGDVYVGASKKLNAATNPYGDENIKGWVDGALTDPALVEHVVNGYFGGVGSTVNRVAQLVKHADEMSGSELITSNWMPIVRTQHYTPNERTRYARTRNKWWYYKEEADKTQETIKVLKKRGEHDPLSFMKSVSEEEGKKGARAKIMEKAYKDYSKTKKKLEKTDDLQKKDLYQLQLDQIMEGAVKELDKIR